MSASGVTEKDCHVIERRGTLQSWTKAAETLPEKIPVSQFFKCVSFSISNFDISTPSPPLQCCNQVKESTECIATLKRRIGGLAIEKKDVFLKLRKDADRKRLFCSTVSTLLSMIVAMNRLLLKENYCDEVIRIVQLSR